VELEKILENLSVLDILSKWEYGASEWITLLVIF
jgi:hypothetical protein